MPDLLKASARDPRDTGRRDSPSADTAAAASSPPDLAARSVFPAAGPRVDDASVSREDEANMRRALGMLGGSPRSAPASGNTERRAPAYNPPNGHAVSHAGGQSSPRRHRFVQDGEVPVTVVRARSEHPPELSRAAAASPVNRIDALQESLVAEQAARAMAERALEEAQGSIRTLQTRLSHLELARDEAVAQAQHFQAQAEAAQAQLRAAMEAAERHLRPDPQAPKPAASADRIARVKRAKQAVEPDVEPEPVKWWLSPQAARSTPARRRARTATTPMSD